MIYEVINPSDPVTIEAKGDLVASAAALILGEGAYGLKREDGEDVDCPLLMFAGSRTEETLAAWCERAGIESIGAYLDSHTEVIATCLDSVVCADFSMRKWILAACKASGGDFEKALAAFNDAKRSSTNNICGHAKYWAEKLRRNAKEKREETSA